MDLKIPTAFSVVWLLRILAAVPPVAAWQSPDELPQAPRLEVESQPVEIDRRAATLTVEEGPSSQAAAEFAGGDAPAVSVPAIIPAEEIVAQPMAIRQDWLQGRPAMAPSPTPTPSVTAPLPHTPRSRPLETNLIAEAVPSPAAAPLRATLFKRAEPGVTTRTQLQEFWGEPQTETVEGEQSVLSYALTPFKQVEAKFASDVLQAIVIRFNTPVETQQISDLLQVGEIDAVEVVDQSGQALGSTFPERGVTFTYAGPGQTEAVAHVLIKPLSSDPFLLRVHSDRRQRWLQNLADLEAAASLTPGDERIYWLQAEVLSQQGEPRQAALAIEKALTAQPQSPLYQLVAAQLIAESGSYGDAIAATSAIYQTKDLPPLLKARAALQLGDLLSAGPGHNFAKALEFHQYAIRLALPLASSDKRDERAAAKRLLIDAHSAVADDIAQGQWQRKEHSVPQWMDRSANLAAEYVQSEGGPESLRFEVICQRLSAYAWLDGKVDPTDVVDQLQRLFDQINLDEIDATLARSLQWRYGKALIDAVDIARARDNAAAALDYGVTAESVLTPLAASDWQNERTQFQLSRLYFLLGSVHAVQLESHAEAVKWFDKGLDDISRPEPDSDLAVAARRGQWMVSMGISYWEQGQRNRGLRLTQVGVGLIEAAKAEGAATDDSLVVPYNNLAVMHEQLGDQQQAKHFAERASEIKPKLQR